MKFDVERSPKHDMTMMHNMRQEIRKKCINFDDKFVNPVELAQKIAPLGKAGHRPRRSWVGEAYRVENLRQAGL